MYTNRPSGVITATKTLTLDDMNRLNQVAGTAPVVLTLPVPQATGMLSTLFVNTTDQNLTVQCPAGSTAITLNNAAAASVAFSTTAFKIGGVLWAFTVNGKWHLINLSTNTATVA